MMSLLINWYRNQWRMMFLPVLVLAFYSVRLISAINGDLVAEHPWRTFASIGTGLIVFANLPMVLFDAMDFDRRRRASMGMLFGAGIYVVSAWWGITHEPGVTPNLWLLASSLGVNIVAAAGVSTAYALWPDESIPIERLKEIA